jgi:cobyrinic acid a,c-diamide synthase
MRLYIGGGFPETHARELEKNQTFKNELKSLARNGGCPYTLSAAD